MFQCPDCKLDNLRICHSIACVSYVDKNGNLVDQDLCDTEWNDNDQALCCDCDWEGTVQAMTIEDPEETIDDVLAREEDRPCPSV